jgi:pyruvate kinase
MEHAPVRPFSFSLPAGGGLLMAFLDFDAQAGQGAAQLIATLGPRSIGLARGMADAGATAFRLNASHLRPDALAEVLASVGRACPEAPVIVDLQGAKMRLGWIAPREVAAGERIRFSIHGEEGFALPHPELYRQVTAGEILTVDDGRLRFRIDSSESSRLDARALGPGTLEPRKGVNVEQHPVRLDGLTVMDREALAAAAEQGVRAFAFSFMATGDEAGWVRERVPEARVVGKVERAEALEALEAIASRTGAIWVCRGDLGAQLGAARLAREVASIAPRRLPVPVLMAGQVLQHLVDRGEPTRSEVCHLHDLLARGYAGIVLSDETAIGRDPVAAVRAASSLLRALTPPAPAAPRWT